MPALDSSSGPFVQKLKEAGIVPLDKPREVFRIPETVRVAEGASYVMATPAGEEEDVLEIIYDLNYGPDSPIGQQVYKIRLTPERFEQSYGDIIASIMSDVPPVLAKMYAGFKVSTDGYDMEGYQRMKLSEQFELFLKADVKPFSTYMRQPYDYRCFDLRDDRDSESSILIVDIHT